MILPHDWGQLLSLYKEFESARQIPEIEREKKATRMLWKRVALPGSATPDTLYMIGPLVKK